MLATTGAALLLVALVSATQAQGPGGGPGGGGPGGRGGFGRRGGGIFGLLDYPAVQEEINLTAEQKTKIADVKDAVSKKRQALMPRRNNNTPNGGPANGAAAGGANPAAGGGQNGVAGGNRGNRRGNNNNNTNINSTPATDADGNPIPGAVSNGGGQGGPGGFGGPGGGGRFQPTPEMQAAFQEMQAYSASADANIATKILDKKQVARLTEIDLQRQGPMAVLRDDIALKLNISEDVLAEMKGIQDQSRQARMEMFQAARQNGPTFQTADGQFDRAAMRAYRDSPEGKTAREKMQKTTETMQNQTIAQIGKFLSNKQKEKFKKMQGKDFDLTKLTNNPTTPATTTPATTSPATATATPATASTTSKAQSKTTAKKKAAGKQATTTSNP